MRYTFQWEVYGSTVIDAPSRNQAQRIFDRMDMGKTIEDGFEEYTTTAVVREDGLEFGDWELTDENDNVIGDENEIAEYTAKKALGVVQ